MQHKTIRRFIANETFWSHELQSQYVSGLSYEVRTSDDKLLDLLDRWIAEGRVIEGGQTATMSGTGEVR
jgi:hypothetical protein